MTVDHETRMAIREAFLSGQLRVRAVSPDSGAVGLHPVSAVLEHDTSHKGMIRVTLIDGRSVVTTVDHSLFHRAEGGLVPVEAGELQVGDGVATVVGEEVVWGLVGRLERLPPEPGGKTYDLSVPGPQNFLLSNGMLAHNSYSIGGISLDIDKSSKYQSLKENAESQFDKLTEAKARTTKFIKGLSQPRFGRGVRSAFGPHVGKNILSPRRFFVWFLAFLPAISSLTGMLS
jgi:hypothetical protein